MSGALPFWKLCGAGNDFVVVDARGGLPLPTDELARRLCPRRISIGADGLIAVTSSAPSSITLDFRNADGSRAAFCGNGARCVARYALANGMAQAPLTIAFPGVVVRASVAGDDIEVELERPAVIEPSLELEVEPGLRLVGARLVAGVEHVVFAEPDGRRLPLPALAARLFQRRPDLEGRVNVTLVKRDGPVVRVRTFERGVGETLACGSGALAAALFIADDPHGASTVTLVPPAEVPLVVRLAANGGRASLTGEARVVYRGVVDL